MDKNKLKLNESEIEFIIFSKPSSLKSLDKKSIFLNNCEVKPSSEARNMYDEIRNTSSQRKFLTTEVACQWTISLVLSDLDYCNSLYTVIHHRLWNYKYEKPTWTTIIL